jgi:N-acetylmuramoyl-L-alanine amidase
LAAGRAPVKVLGISWNSTEAAVETPPVISRSQWGARPFKGEVRSLGPLRQIVVHHAAGYGAATRHEGARQVLALQKLHQGPQCNCPDIGYHFLVDAGGHIYQGRPYYKGEQLADLPQFALGSHVLNVDSHKLGVCLLGCFHAEGGECGDTPTPEALEGLELLLGFVCRGYAVRPSDILTHRDFVPTSCPGEKLYVAVSHLRARLSHTAGVLG